jgi:hypothetical protein
LVDIINSGDEAGAIATSYELMNFSFRGESILSVGVFRVLTERILVEEFKLRNFRARMIEVVLNNINDRDFLNSRGLPLRIVSLLN